MKKVIFCALCFCFCWLPAKAQERTSTSYAGQIAAALAILDLTNLVEQVLSTEPTVYISTLGSVDLLSSDNFLGSYRGLLATNQYTGNSYRLGTNAFSVGNSNTVSISADEIWSGSIAAAAALNLKRWTNSGTGTNFVSTAATGNHVDYDDAIKAWRLTAVIGTATNSNSSLFGGRWVQETGGAFDFSPLAFYPVPTLQSALIAEKGLRLKAQSGFPTKSDLVSPGNVETNFWLWTTASASFIMWSDGANVYSNKLGGS